MIESCSGTTLRILFVKPYQYLSAINCSPLLGVLLLASALRQRFGDAVEVRIVDAKLKRRDAADLQDELAWADVVGLTALNYEVDAAFAIARLAKKIGSGKLVVLGGPLAHQRAEELLGRCDEIDWIFDGEADRSFPEAIARRLAGEPPDGSIPGMYFRSDGGVVSPIGNDVISDLDQLPWPAWDLVDFEAYTRVQNMNGWMRGRRYAVLFTSRGCPYKCAYCHDIFGKKYRWRSAEDVVAEMSMLIDRYGVDEFQIVDDIFNLHKPRLKRIFALLRERYPGRRFHFCFPNGLRADIIDRDVLRALREGGTYQITIAIETVTERLQALMQKNLDLERTQSVIDWCAEEGILVRSFFMLGFPTETPREIWNTVRFALRSRLTFANFFAVIPQPGTLLYDLASQEGPEALERGAMPDYWGGNSWYQFTYGYPLKVVIFLAMVLFHLHPRRVFAVARGMGLRWCLFNVGQLSAIILGANPVESWRRRRGALLVGESESCTAAPAVQPAGLRPGT